jgi:hypothetical protein
MRAFLSYGLFPNEMYWVTILAEQMQRQGYEIITSPDLESSLHGNLKYIFSSHVYVGLLTNPNETQRMIYEFNNAIRKIPSILAIDANIYSAIKSNPSFKINPKMRENLIILDAQRLDVTISSIRGRLEKLKSENDTKNAAWVVGGLALLTLLIILSENK